MRSTVYFLVTLLFVVFVRVSPASAAVIDLHLVPVSSLTGSDTAFSLPSPIAADVPVGSLFYLEVWMKDVGSPLWGITGGYLDISYDTSKMDASALSHGGLYINLASGTIKDPDGLVDEFGGAWLPPSAGDTPPGKNDWARLGWVSFARTATGTVTFTPQQSDDEFSRSTGGAVTWSQIDAHSAIVPEPASMTVLALGGLALLRRSTA